MRRLVIGDIHGCYEELEALIREAGIGPGDEIIGLGDVVDRGPESLQVLEFFRKDPRARTLQGNHERKHVRSNRKEIAPALSQIITRQQFKDEACYQESCDWMDHLPRYLEFDEAILVHGFLEPGVPLQQQRETILVGTLSGEKLMEGHGGIRWYERYQGRKPLVFGHHDYLDSGEPVVIPGKVYGLDTGCCHGRRLTGLLLPDFELISVPSRADHWRAVQGHFVDLRFRGAACFAATWQDLEKAARRLRARGVDKSKPGGFAIAVLEACHRSVDLLYRHVLVECERVLGEVRQGEACDPPDERQMAQRFASAVGTSCLAFYLFEARKGRLTTALFFQKLKTPEAVLSLMRKAGLEAEMPTATSDGDLSPPPVGVLDDDTD